VIDETLDAVVCSVGLSRVDERNASAELTCWVAPEARRQRVASRSCAALSRWAFEHGYQRLEVLTDRLDVAGARTAIAAGFTYEATKISASAGTEGARDDVYVWRRLPADPDGPAKRLLPDPPAAGVTDGVVTIRPQVAADAECFVSCWKDTQTQRWLNQPAEKTVERARLEIRRGASDVLIGHAAHFTVVEVATGLPCGDCTVGLAMPEMGIAQLGYMIHPEFRGRGYAVRAAQLAAEWAMTVPAIGRLEISAAADNAASLRVIEKAGFRYEGTIRGYHPNPDGPRLDAKQSARVRD
jgi:RimJ/RimL family protein N-acetyltransferase